MWVLNVIMTNKNELRLSLMSQAIAIRGNSYWVVQILHDVHNHLVAFLIVSVEELL